MVHMGSDPGSELPRVQENSSSNNLSNKKPSGNQCSICGLTARNDEELNDHIKHAHNPRDPDNKNNAYSEEQKIDPFVNTDS